MLFYQRVDIPLDTIQRYLRRKNIIPPQCQFVILKLHYDSIEQNIYNSTFFQGYQIYGSTIQYRKFIHSITLFYQFIK
ncbi:hypothetical protein pb186bvf_016269 [Paramecium bursaria]